MPSKPDMGSPAAVRMVGILLAVNLLPPSLLAQEITTSVTNPIATSTIDNGNPGNVTITSTGSIILTGDGLAQFGGATFKLRF
jgi:hypothetical protein